MQKHLLALMGSPRPGGNTDVLVDEAMAAFTEAGGTAEKVAVCYSQIRGCQGCLACMGGEGLDTVCAVADDMRGLYPRLIEANALLWATPIYTWSPTAQFKAFLDRLFPFGEYQQTRWRCALKGKPIGLVIVYADPDPLTAGVPQTRDILKVAAEACGGRVPFFIHSPATGRGDAGKDEALVRRVREAAARLYEEA